MPSVTDYQHTLLHLAGQDLRAAELLAAHAGCDDETVGFHCQQALEEAIKAVLETCRIEYPLTVLLLLLTLVEARLAPCPVTQNDARQFNPYAVRFRYERTMPEPDPRSMLDRTDALRVGRLCVKWAEKLVKGD